MGTISNLVIRSSWDQSQLNSGVDKSTKKLNKFGKEAKGTAGGLNTATLASTFFSGGLKGVAASAFAAGAGLTFATAGISAIAAVIGAAVSGLGALGIGAAKLGSDAVMSAADFEQLATSFETMTGSAEQATALLNQLNQFAASTPFELSEVNDAARKLLAFSVGADQVTGKLHTLGDIAAGSGAELNDLVLIFGKVRSKGKTELEQLNQLAERGIPIIEVLAKRYDTSTASLLKMVSAGKVGFADFEAALISMREEGGLFDNAMETQSNTLAGVFSTLKGNVGLAMIEIGTAIEDTFDLTSLVRGIDSFVRSGIEIFKDWLPVIKAFGDSMKSIGVAVWDVFTEVLTIVFDYFKMLGNLFGLNVDEWVGWKETAVGAFAVVEFGFLRMLNFIQQMIAGVKVAAAALLVAANPFSKAAKAAFSEARSELAGLIKDSKNIKLNDIVSERLAGLNVDQSDPELKGDDGGGGSPIDEDLLKATEDADKLIAKLQESVDQYGMSSTAAEIFRLRQRGVADETLAAAEALQKQLDQMKVDDSADKFVAKLQEQIATFGMSSEAAAIYKLRLEGASEETLAHAEALTHELDQLQKIAQAEKDAAKAAEQRQKDLQTFADATVESLETPEEKLLEQANKLREIFDAGLIDKDQLVAALDKAKQDLAGGGDGGGEVKLSGALEAGSEAARSAILRGQFASNKPINRIEQHAKEQVDLLKENNKIQTALLQAGGGVVFSIN